MITLIAFFVTLGVLITFHELGHYLVARWCGVEVQRFSIGFGKILLTRTDKHGTEWALSAIPLGGYVKMLEQADALADGFANKAFNSKPVASRFAIVAAGPLFNLALAVLLYACLNIVGQSEPVPILSMPKSGSPAAVAGLQSGDQITAVDNVATQSWPQVRYQLLRKVTEGGAAEITIDRHGQTLTKSLTFESPTDLSKTDPLRLAGLRLGGTVPIVNGVVAASVADQAGLRKGDLILAVNDLKNPDVIALIDYIQSKGNQSITLKIERDNRVLTIDLTPREESLQDGSKVGRIGVQLGGDPQMVEVRYGLFESLWRAMERTADTSVYSLQMMWKMVTGEVSWRNISGPVTIADYAGQTAKIGLSAYIGFLALVSISLGILNLLPIPMLDGGHLLYYLIEVAKGSPLADKWQQVAQKIGMGVLACLMIIALFNDFARLFT